MSCKIRVDHIVLLLLAAFLCSGCSAAFLAAGAAGVGGFVYGLEEDSNAEEHAEDSTDGNDDNQQVGQFYRGAAASLWEDSDHGLIVAIEEGFGLIADTNGPGSSFTEISGVTVYNSDSETMIIKFGDDGLPAEVHIDGHTILLENYIDGTVDVAYISPEGEIEIVRDVDVDSGEVDALRSIASINADKEIASVRRYDTDDISTWTSAVSLGASIAGCVFSAVFAIVSHGAAIPIAVAACGSMALNIAGEFHEDDNAGIALQANAFSIDTLLCIAVPGGQASCINAALSLADAAATGYDASRNGMQSQFNQAEAAIMYGGGSVQASLTWDNGSDLDLWVTDPNGEKIFFAHKNSDSGGELDVDDTNGYGPENIFWPLGQAPSGQYKVEVDYFSGVGTANWDILVIRNGNTEAFSGSLEPDQTTLVTTFTM